MNIVEEFIKKIKKLFCDYIVNESFRKKNKNLHIECTEIFNEKGNNDKQS